MLGNCLFPLFQRLRSNNYDLVYIQQTKHHFDAQNLKQHQKAAFLCQKKKKTQLYQNMHAIEWNSIKAFVWKIDTIALPILL